MSARLRLTRLSIQDFPGLPGPLDLSPHLGAELTLVSGSNASGKTVTARAIAAALWPQSALASQATLLAHWANSEQEWRVRLRGGRLQTQCNGRDCAPPYFAPETVMDRYFLDLRDLLIADDAELARIVQRECSGGFDIQSAKTALGYKFVRPRRNHSSEALQRAQREVQTLRTTLADLKREEDRLPELRAQLDQQDEQARSAWQWQRGLAARQRQRERDRLARELAAYPDAVAKCTGNEAAELDRLRTALQQEKERCAAANDKKRRALQTMAGTGLGSEGAAQGLLEAAKAEVETLEEAEQALQAAQTSLARARAERDAVARHLGTVADDPGPAPDIAAVHELTRLVSEGQELEGRISGLRAIQSWMESHDDDAWAPTSEQLDDAVAALWQWLEAAPAANGGTVLWLASAGFMVGAGALAATIVLPVPDGRGVVAGVLAALGLGIGGWCVRQRQIAARNRARAKAVLDRNTASAPAAWTLAEVFEHLRRLGEQRERAVARRRRLERWRDLQHRLQECEAQWAAFQDRVRTWTCHHGLQPSESVSFLRHLAWELRAWSDADLAVGQAQGEVDDAAERCERTLKAVQGRLAVFIAPPDTLPEAKAALKVLQQRQTQWQDASTALEHAQETLDLSRQRLAEIQKEYAALFTDRALEAGDEQGLLHCVQQRESYLELSQKLHAIQTALESDVAMLPDTVWTFDDDSLHRFQEQALAAEQQRTETANAIAVLEDRIARARTSRDMEEAQQRVLTAKDQLLQERDEAAATTAGYLLCEHLQRHCREEQVPGVLGQANTLFVQMTNGAFQLAFDPQTPAFRARQSASGQELELDQLSAATRIQLLLAVRLGFVQTQENHARLPLVLDETLANTDALRAESVIRSLLEIGGSDRQILYFTAQDEEIQKWQTLAEKAGINWAHIDLDTAGREAEKRCKPRLSTAPSRRRHIPPADDLDHAAYGERLDVAGIDPRRDSAESLHIWYVLDDPPLVQRILEMGVTRWGSLQQLLETRALRLVSPDAPEIRRARALAGAYEAALRGWRIGRGRPVGQKTLEAAGVKNTFLGEVSAILDEVDGNAAALLAALEQGRVKRFRKETRLAMRDYFEAHGFLDQRPPLDAADLREQVMIATAEDLEQGCLTVADIETVLKRTGGQGFDGED